MIPSHHPPWMPTMVLPEAASATSERWKCSIIGEKEAFLLNVAPYIGEVT